MGATKKQCEELLEFIRHLAEDDKEGVMAVKVCSLTQCVDSFKKDKCFNGYHEQLQLYTAVNSSSTKIGISSKIAMHCNLTQALQSIVNAVGGKNAQYKTSNVDTYNNSINQYLYSDKKSAFLNKGSK